MHLLPQELRTIDVARLAEHPRNPNLGSIDSLAESIDVNGFYGAIVVQKSTGYIIAGNHRYRAAVAAGATTIPAFVLDVDDDAALRIMLVDNRETRKGRDDASVLSAILAELQTTDKALVGTGYDAGNLDALLTSLNGLNMSAETPLSNDQWIAAVTFNNENELAAFHAEMLGRGLVVKLIT